MIACYVAVRFAGLDPVFFLPINGLLVGVACRMSGGHGESAVIFCGAVTASLLVGTLATKQYLKGCLQVHDSSYMALVKQVTFMDCVPDPPAMLFSGLLAVCLAYLIARPGGAP